MPLIARNLYLLMFVAMALPSARSSAQQSTDNVCPRDPAAFAQVQSKATDQDPAAETALASCYDLGFHVQPSRSENMRWLTAAAEQGYAPAQYELGRTYLYGRGIPADYALALRWEQKAADQGDARAQRDLAFMYERGFGVTADPALAAAWNRKAAGQGQPEAQMQLAKALESGAGVTKDPAEAEKWYTKAADHEQPAAQLRLAQLHAHDADCKIALHLYKEAAAGGELQAAHELGMLYLTKKCGADRAQAYLWFTIGARFGRVDSKTQAEKLSPSLSPARRRTALSQAELWIKQHPGADKEENEKEEDEKEKEEQ